MAILNEMGEVDDGGGDDEPHVKRTRRVFLRADYSQSPWAIMLGAEELSCRNSRQAKGFRRRFRVPYPFFLAIVEMVKTRGWFPSRAEDVTGRPCIPVELKVCCWGGWLCCVSRLRNCMTRHAILKCRCRTQDQVRDILSRHIVPTK